MKDRFNRLADYVFTDEFQDKAVKWGFITFATLEVICLIATMF